MNENLFETQYDVTKKSKLKKFYEVNKILIFSVILILIIAIASVSFYSETKEKKKILLSDNYLAAKVYLENGDRNKVKNILKTIIFNTFFYDFSYIRIFFNKFWAKIA